MKTTTFFLGIVFCMFLLPVSLVQAQQLQGSFQGGSWLDAYVQIQQTVTPIGSGSSFQQNGSQVTGTIFGNQNNPSNNNSQINGTNFSNPSSNNSNVDLVDKADFSKINQTNFSNSNIINTTNGVSTTIPNNSGSCPTNFVTVLDILLFLKCIITVSIIPLLFAIAISVFVWGIIQYIKNAADAKKREEGRNFMIYGVVSIFVIVSMWGLVGFLRNTFFGGTGTIFLPRTPQQQSPQ